MEPREAQGHHPPREAAGSGGGDRVVLLHGLGRSRWSLALPARWLRAAGFEPLAIGYPSRRLAIPALARLVARGLPGDDGGRRLHFLTHSMGGIVLRWLLAERPPANLGRVVMLSPPLRGSRLVDRLRASRLFRLVTGPAGQQLGTGPEGVAARLGPVRFELGIITGDRSWNPLAALSGRPGDGKVALDEAAVEGMRDFLVVRRGHTFVMNDRAVIDQAIHFFLHGRFARGAGVD